MDCGQGLVGGARLARAMTLILQDARHKFADIRLVINDKNVSAHAGTR
jgi:hypothetical protein